MAWELCDLVWGSPTEAPVLAPRSVDRVREPAVPTVDQVVVSGRKRGLHRLSAVRPCSRDPG